MGAVGDGLSVMGWGQLAIVYLSWDGGQWVGRSISHGMVEMSEWVYLPTGWGGGGFLNLELHCDPDKMYLP